MTFITPSCDMLTGHESMPCKADRTAVFFFIGFDASEQTHIEAWDALKAEDTYTAFHSRMENSVGTLFFSASLFCCQEKPASCHAVKCPQPPHPAERTLHVSFCPFFVAGTGRTVSLATPSFRLFTIYRKSGGLRWLLIRAMS